MSNLITTLLTASLASGFTLQPTSPSGPRGLTSAQLASSGSVMEPLPLLPATKQYRGATVRANTDQVGLVSQHPLHICICKMGLRRSVGTLDLSEFHTTFLSLSLKGGVHLKILDPRGQREHKQAPQRHVFFLGGGNQSKLSLKESKSLFCTE